MRLGGRALLEILAKLIRIVRGGGGDLAVECLKLVKHLGCYPSETERCQVVEMIALLYRGSHTLKNGIDAGPHILTALLEIGLQIGVTDSELRKGSALIKSGLALLGENLPQGCRMQEVCSEIRNLK